eukprot:maker-scaffold349_size200065-snap-gene-1.26 protein:Tk10540 transcript:maker-scaffold349_size200065-snap-gene-1.26-mRNA-1 annotation:"hypothetical protein DAPPUDRAFT_96576"
MNRNEFTIVLVIQLTHAWVQAQMSPSGYCQISNQHTLCRYQGLSNQCGMPLKQGLDQNEVRTLVDVHNQLRSGLAQGQEGRGAPGPQPSASNMLEMTWDEELAAVAQRWADQCQFAHDAVRDVDRFKVGQNVYITTRSHDQPLAMTINEGVMGWYDEVRDVDRQIVDRYQFASATGHYTQLIWANTNRIGCGHVTYPSGRLLKKLLICNYGPSGNFIGSPMYQMGDPCSQCPSNTQCSVQYSGLCSKLHFAAFHTHQWQQPRDKLNSPGPANASASSTPEPFAPESWAKSNEAVPLLLSKTPNHPGQRAKARKEAANDATHYEY